MPCQNVACANSLAFHTELQLGLHSERFLLRSRSGSPLMRFLHQFSLSWSNSAATQLLCPFLTTTHTHRLSALALSLESQSGGTSNGVISWWDKATRCLQQLITPSEMEKPPQTNKNKKNLVKYKNKNICAWKEQSCVSLNLDYVTSVDVRRIH